MYFNDNDFERDLISELMWKKQDGGEDTIQENAVPSKFAFVGDKRKRDSSEARAGKSLRKDIIDNPLTGNTWLDYKCKRERWG